MPPPPLRTGLTEQQYRAHFESEYCRGPIITHDGIRVRFGKAQFDHCMFESDRRTGVKLSAISTKRAERIDWIKATLTDETAEIYEGWDKVNKNYDRRRRVAFVFEDYVAVIALGSLAPDGVQTASFVTAYCAENSLAKIRSSPRWIPQK